MARLSQQLVDRARDTIALYPHPRSALIPLLHMAQEQDGWVTSDAMEHIAELLDLTPAEVRGTASFYDMLFLEPVGKYLVSICTNIACLLNGGYELLEHAEEKLDIKAGATTADGKFTIEEVECIALCGQAPCLAVNWRFFGKVTNEGFDHLVDELAAGRLENDIPPHGTLCRVRRAVGLLGSAQATEAASDVAPVQEAPEAGIAQPDQKVEAESGESKPSSQRATEDAASDAAKLESPPGGPSAPGEKGEG
ncbi:MAG: NADH-quinone oxidoreductase subunit NuoE [Acidimicrobiia bacterium]|nr:NADH-quinone oxidoreductase subunit NuoE [Acidimicrobiia bacterium]